METFLASVYGQLTLLAASWAALTGGLWKIAERADKVISGDGKTRTALWLRSLPVEQAAHVLGESLAHAFDATFSSKHLSWRCFWRSALASTLFSSVLLMLWLSLFGSSSSRRVPFEETWELFVFIFLSTAGINLIPDYLSLLKTRYVIRRLTMVNRKLQTGAWLLLDAAGSLTLGICGAVSLWLLANAADGEVRSARQVTTSITSGVGDLLLLRGSAPPPAGLWVYATFFTSVWVWLFLLSRVLVRLGQTVARGHNVAVNWLDIDRQPFLVLGAVSIGLVTALYILAVPFVVLF